MKPGGGGRRRPSGPVVRRLHLGGPPISRNVGTPVNLVSAIRPAPAMTDTSYQIDPAGGVKGDGTSDISGTAPLATVEGVEALVRQRLVLDDPDAVRVILAAVAAHSLEGDPVWLMVVGPPSGAKTELLTMVRLVPGIFPLSELTSRTFASGLKVEGADPSLLARLKNEVLIFKDFTTVLQMHRDERQAVLAQLREIYDGAYDKAWGTGKELHWTGRLGFIAGVTPVIDSHHSVMAVLGQRFVLLRLRQPDRKDVAKRAIQNTRRDRQAREMALGVAAFMANLSPVDPLLTDAYETTISELADFATRARSGVERDGYSRQLEYAPEPEMPGRLARQLASLAQGLARLSNHPEVADEDIRRVVRVGLDCIPPPRRSLLVALAAARQEARTLAPLMGLPLGTVRRGLEDPKALGFLTASQKGKGTSEQWGLRPEWQGPVSRFSEMSAGSSPSTEGTRDGA